MSQVQVEYSLPAGDGTERRARAWAGVPLVPAHGSVPHLGSA